MYEEYKALCSTNKHLLPGTVHSYMVDQSDSRPDVFNLFTQFQPGSNGDYAYLEQAIYNMKNAIAMTKSVFHIIYGQSLPYRVGMPWIGCGIAGLEKHNVEHILRWHLTDSVDEFVLVEQPTV
jgi:hypothetical protein